MLTILLFACCSLVGQEMIIPNLTVGTSVDRIEIPVYILPPASSHALQLSILWPENQLQFDSVVFDETLDNPSFSAVHNIPVPGELRVVVFPSGGFFDPIKISEDSVGLMLHFSPTDQFTGNVDLIFNPDFQNMFGGHAETTVTTNGTLTTSTTVSTNNLRADLDFQIVPNPYRSQFKVTGLPPGETTYSYAILDALGRAVTSGILSNDAFITPEQLPGGLYYLRVNTAAGMVVSPLVVAQQ